MLRRCGWLAVLAALVAGALPVAALAGDAAAAQVVLDGVRIDVSGAALSGLGPFDAAPAGSAVQSASATRQAPYGELSLAAIPFGTTDPGEPVLSIARAGGSGAARAALRRFRESEHARRLESLSAELFGTEVPGDAYLVDLRLAGPAPVPTVLAEWVTQAGSRLWLVRAARQVAGSASAASVLSEIGSLSAAATPAGLAQPTTLGRGRPSPQTSQSSEVSSTGPINIGPEPTVPFPSWWSGDCDTVHYAAASQQLTGSRIPSYRLSSGADWNGLEACGPRPYYNEGPDVSVLFPGASWSVLEFECVELSMRWMYEAWGVEPYPANGSGVVWNYNWTKGQYNPHGPSLVAVSNNGSGTLPSPGDVLSYGSTSSAGHTSVVTAVNVNGSGNGSVSVLEENASSTGWDSVSVNGWVLGGFDGGVSGWLHDPGYHGNFSSLQPSARYLAGDFSGSGRDGLDAMVGGANWVFSSNGSGLGQPVQWSTHSQAGARANLAGDVTGSGRDDLVAVGDSSTWVYPSTGSGFAAPQEWSAVPFYGGQATLLADVTGNGRADLIAVDGNDVRVMLSTGSAFSAPVQWSSVGFTGVTSVLAGDVNGDGRADLIGVGPGGTWVMQSTGTGFSAPVLRSATPFYGTRQTLAADLTGDGRSDIVAVDGDSVWVMASDGTSFGRPLRWYGAPFAGSQGTFAADVAGNGLGALIAVDGDVAWVMQSTGSGFDPPTSSTLW